MVLIRSLSVAYALRILRPRRRNAGRGEQTLPNKTIPATHPISAGRLVMIVPQWFEELLPPGENSGKQQTERRREGETERDKET
jgi:hypothetical protein